MSSENDHRILNRDLEVFYLSEELGPGLPGWAPRGMAVRDELESWLRELEFREGYRRIASPPLAPESLYRRSGHLAFYADGMFPAMDGLRLRPMNCPHHHLYFASRPRSERELPYRLAEFGQVFRDEPSGSLLGLHRARCFSQNDAHIYVLPEQARDEIGRVLRLFLEIYRVLGLSDVRFRLSLADFSDPSRAGKFVREPDSWRRAEGILREALEAVGLAYEEAPGEAAFYGPKIDVQLMSARGSEEGIASLQLDFMAGRNFDLEVALRGGGRAVPWVIHRAPLGSFERFVGFLLEQDRGWLPFWLSPDQVAVLPVAERHVARAKEIVADLRRERVRAVIDDRGEGLSRKIRDALRLRIPVIAVIGDREVADGRVALRERGGGSLVMQVKDLRERMIRRHRERAP